MCSVAARPPAIHTTMPEWWTMHSSLGVFQITVFIMASHLTGKREDLMNEHNNARIGAFYIGQWVARSQRNGFQLRSDGVRGCN